MTVMSASPYQPVRPGPVSGLRGTTITLLTIAIVFSLSTLDAVAQSSRSKDKDKEKDKDAPNTVQLEIRVTKAEESLLKEYMEVANEYYKQGAKEAIEKLPDRTAKKKRSTN